MVNPPVHSPLLARRPFLLRTATLASGMALSPRLSAYASANDEIRLGFLSCGGRANICFQAGDHRELGQKVESARNHPGWEELIEQTIEHLNSQGIDPGDQAIRMSHWMELDTKTGRFVGQYAEQGNALIKRQYRAGYAVPQIV